MFSTNNQSCAAKTFKFVVSLFKKSTTSYCDFALIQTVLAQGDTNKKTWGLALEESAWRKNNQWSQLNWNHQIIIRFLFIKHDEINNWVDQLPFFVTFHLLTGCNKRPKTKISTLLKDGISFLRSKGFWLSFQTINEQLMDANLITESNRNSKTKTSKKGVPKG